MSVKNIEDIYRLSPMQQGMLFHSLYAPENGAYFEQSSWTLRGDINLDAFKKAWQTTINRHTSLRTAFMWEDLDEPLQVVYRNVDIPFGFLDWQDINESIIPSKLDEFMEQDRRSGFQLSEPPLIRLTLIKINDKEYIFILSNHHLLMDGWSQPIIFQDVLLNYEAYARGAQAHLPSPRPYRDYIAWLQKQDYTTARMYWQEYLKGFTAPTTLPNEHLAEYSIYTTAEAISHTDDDYQLYRYVIPEDLTNGLQDQVQKSQITLNTMVQGAWSLVLSQYSGEKDVLFGSTVSGRPPELTGSDSIVGLFINTLPTRVKINPDDRIIDWLKEIQNQQVTSRQYDFTPLVDIQSWSEVSHDLPLFKSLLIFENYPLANVKQEGENRILLEQGEIFTRTNYPLTIAFSPGNQIGLEIGYDKHFVSDSTIEAIVNQLTMYLSQLVGSIEQHIKDLYQLRDNEKNQVLVEWNTPDITYQDGKCVHQYFEDQVSLSPEAIALRSDDIEITYDQLNKRANQLANFLRKKNIGTDSLVGVSIERSVDMIVAILGILKAGAAYVPLDPSYPSDRLNFMIDDSGLDLILTLKVLDRNYQTPVVYLDRDWDKINRENSSNLEIPYVLDTLAYVIYTSGSTGIPKGVTVTHRSLVNHALSLAAIVKSDIKDRVLMFISLNFDASAETIYPTLLSGASLVLPDSSQNLLGADLLRYIDQQKITILHVPVPIWQHSVDSLLEEGVSIPDSLRMLHMGGELIAVDKLKLWSEAASNRNVDSPMELVNAYGPTEATIAVTVFKSLCDPAIIALYPRIPIGRPIPNVKLYILNDRMQPVPVGAPGELYIGGISLARGYLNRPIETAKSFISDPFDQREGGRLYKTGDLARYLPDGNIEFLGRVDFQVKIRGFRVELGEIETVLRKFTGVRDVIADIKTDQTGEKQLVAYILQERSFKDPISSLELREFLAERLPNYMIPSIFMQIEEIPLTPSGKTDRRALPEPDEIRKDLIDNYLPPRSAVEDILTGIWAEVLGVERVGIKDNFYDLGGHSLKATQLISRIRQVFDIEIPIRALFETPDVEGVAHQIEMMVAGLDSKSTIPPLDPIVRDEITGLPVESPQLSFSQQRLWFLEQLDPGNIAWNIPIFVRINGQLDLKALELSLQLIIHRHEVLRTTFTTKEGKPTQEIHPDLQTSIEITDISTEVQDLDEAAEIEQVIQLLGRKEVQKPFDLEYGPLFRARVIRMDPSDHILILTMHHIISDGWSLGILVRELTQSYKVFVGLRNSGIDLEEEENLLDKIDYQENYELTDHKIQYADYSEWQRNWLQGEILDSQLEYWREQLKNLPPVLELPTDKPRPALKTSAGATHKFILNNELSSKILNVCQNEGITPYMFLLAAFQTLLYRYSGQEDIPIGTAVANRTRKEIESLIGFFVNTLVMRGDLSGNPSFRELLHRTRETAIGAYAHQDIPFEMLVEELSPERNLSYSPLFQVGFDFQDNPIDSLHLPELTLQPVQISSGTAPYDLLLSITRAQDNQSGTNILGGGLDYNTDIFERTTIERMITHFEVLLQNIADELDRRISTVPILTQDEYQELILDWNDTEAKYPIGITIHQMFENQVAIQPDEIAITFNGDSLSYSELNRKANQLAHYLRKKGLHRDVLVGISTDRSPEMVIGILGVLKAGGAYLPLDPTYPTDRLRFMIEDSGISLLLTKAEISKSIPKVSEMILLDDEWENIEGESDENLLPESGSENLAYSIYTSGSTGNPKGVLLEHDGLCNLAEAQRIEFGIDKTKKVLQFSPFSFDASVWETFMALANGGTLCLAKQEILASGRDLLRLLREEKITTVTLPPSVLGVLIDEDVSRQAIPELETVIAAGEACTKEIVSRWAPGRKFYNAYGPTETTVCASMKLCDENGTHDPPIGRPIANTQLYVLDRNLQPVPVGVPGELLVGGVSLSRGYLNRPEITADKFIPSPFKKKERRMHIGVDDLLYRTGDLVRYLPDGDIEYLGRIDNQVKVRGHRIELGEIETVIRKNSELGDIKITDAVVIVREDVPGDQRIVSYLTVKGKQDRPGDVGIVVSGLRDLLRESLPEYMVPSAYVVLDSMPLSPAGKIDRLALAKLPAPEIGRQELSVEFVEPRTPTEEKLSEIASEILGIEKTGKESPIGVYDNFFELGGHSLLATQFLSRVRDVYNVELPLRTLFEHPTVADIAMEIEILEKKNATAQPMKIQRVSRETRRIQRTSLDSEEQ